MGLTLRKIRTMLYTFFIFGVVTIKLSICACMVWYGQLSSSMPTAVGVLLTSALSTLGTYVGLVINI